jgi:hypothetical protein
MSKANPKDYPIEDIRGAAFEYAELGSSTELVELISSAEEKNPTIEKIGLLMEAAVNASSTTFGNKEELLPVIKKYFIEEIELRKSYKEDPHALDKLAAIIFQDKNFKGEDLKEEKTFKFNDINVELAELLYTAGGFNLQRYVGFVNTLKTGEGGFSEGNKQKLLEIINASNLLCKVAEGKHQVIEQNVLDYALKRFCFLIANNTVSDTNFDGARYLLKYAKRIEFPEDCEYDFDKIFTEYLTTECSSIKKFKAVLKQYGPTITEVLQDRGKLVVNLQQLDKNFWKQVDQLYDKIVTILKRPTSVLSISEFKQFLKSDKLPKIKVGEHLKLKFYEPREDVFQLNDDIAEQPLLSRISRESMEYYRVNLKILEPALSLIQIAKQQDKIEAIQEFLEGLHAEAEKIVQKKLEAIKAYKNLLGTLTDPLTDPQLDKFHVYQSIKINIPKIKEDIKKRCTQKADVKNITSLCKFVGKFIEGFKTIIDLFIEAEDSYVNLDQKIFECTTIGDSLYDAANLFQNALST